MRIYIDKKIEKVGMGSEEMYGKYPTLSFKLEDGTVITFTVNKEDFYKIKDLISHIDIENNRWISDGDDEDFEFKK